MRKQERGFSNAQFSTGFTNDYPGWYTIDLDQPVDIEDKNTKFAIVIKITSPDGTQRSYRTYK